MKRTQITVTALLTSLMPTASVMAHSEITDQSGILALAHDLVHALQAAPMLSVTILAVLATVYVAFRINKRES
jgi:hypothetical protein